MTNLTEYYFYDLPREVRDELIDNVEGPGSTVDLEEFDWWTIKVTDTVPGWYKLILNV